MRDKILTGIGAIFLIGILLLISKCQDTMKSDSGSSNIDIENAGSIKEVIIGKWSTSFTDLGTTWYYRFEISENEIKYWTRFGQWEWKQEPEKVHSYYLSDIARDTYGAKYRFLAIEDVDLGLKRGGGLTFENGCLRFNGGCLSEGWD